ncbi:MAG: 5-formyltetrahydrofolate cyclo-ligase [Firmicutes bacterium]|nr:5-formyltetrahydrofolate cyclo-ligase [Bacillota bacterium]
MNTGEEKRRVRREYRLRLAGFDHEEVAQKSALITARALALPQLQAAKTVGAYASIGNEVATENLLASLLSAGKNLVLPVVKGDGIMEFRAVTDLDRLTPGVFGIPEPRAGELCLPEKIDLLFIPGLAFDRRGGRLGRGKGYFDRYLARAAALRPDLIKVALAFSGQLAAAVPRDDWDLPMDLVITEEEVIICRKEPEE